MKKILGILILGAVPFLNVQAQKSDKPYRPHYSKYASSGSSLDRHHKSSGDYSALARASADQKRMNTDLKKLEAQSGHVQSPSQKSAKVRPLPIKTEKPSEKMPAINFQSKPAKSKVTAGPASRPSRSPVRGHKSMGMR
jgi:hypothetical protein